MSKYKETRDEGEVMFIRVENDLIRVEDIKSINYDSRMWIDCIDGRNYTYEYSKDMFNKICKYLAEKQFGKELEVEDRSEERAC